MNFYTYILQSLQDSSYYIGSCGDYNKRLKQHNNGEVVSTKNKRPWQLVYYEKFSKRGDAVQKEKKIKSWKKRRAIEKLIHHHKK